MSNYNLRVIPFSVTSKEAPFLLAEIQLVEGRFAGTFMGANDLYWLLCARSERRTLELVERFQGEIFEVAAPIESHCGNAEASPMTN
jgi:hypothetical protein